MKKSQILKLLFAFLMNLDLFRKLEFIFNNQASS